MTYYTLSCRENISNNKSVSKKTIPSTLIQSSIDSTIVLDSAINTKTFWVDLETLKRIDPMSVKLYIDEHPNLRVINYDSLVKVKSSWLQENFRNNNVIYFEKVVNNGTDTFFVKTTKRRVDGSFGTEIIFVSEGSKLRCVKSEITWIE